MRTTRFFAESCYAPLYGLTGRYKTSLSGVSGARPAPKHIFFRNCGIPLYIIATIETSIRVCENNSIFLWRVGGHLYLVLQDDRKRICPAPGQHRSFTFFALAEASYTQSLLSERDYWCSGRPTFLWRVAGHLYRALPDVPKQISCEIKKRSAVPKPTAWWAPQSIK